MAEEELSHEHQLDNIATRVNFYRVDGIVPELFLMPSFLKYFPVVMEPGVLTDVNWNNISGLFVQSSVLPMMYVDNDVLVAMSKQQVWETDSSEGYHPRRSLVMVKLYPSAPVYALTTVYVPAIQERLKFLTALSGLHNLQMEAVTLIYMPKNCLYMPEPSSGDHYTLLPLTRDKDICIGALSTFAAAKLTVASTHSSSSMGVYLKLPGRFGPDLDNKGLISKLALCHGPIWKNADFIVRGDDGRHLLENGDPVAMKSPIKEIDQFTPLNCTALTNVGYEPKFANNAFAFRESVVEIRQHLDRTRVEAARQTAAELKAAEPMITEERHQEALAAACVPMYASRTSNIEVALMLGMQFVDPAKYLSFLGIKPDKGEEVTTASAGTPAQAPRDSAAMDTVPAPTETTTGVEGTQRPLDPRRLCQVLGEMNNSLEHLEWGYFYCFHDMVKATWEVLADINEIDATYVDTVLTAMAKWQKDVTLVITDMYTDDCVVWDAKRNAIDEATQKFGETCEASRIKHAAAHEARQKAVVAGNEKDPVIELLDRVLVKTRQVVNKAVENFQKQFKEVLAPRVPAEHLPILVSNANNTISQFCMTIWRMVADECIMPMRHDYLMNHGLASVMQHTLEKVLSTCMRIVPPHPPEPKDNLMLFLDSLGNSSATRAPVTPVVHPTVAPPVMPIVPPPAIAPLPGISALGMRPVPTTSIPVFGGVPLASVPASMVTGVSLFPTTLPPPPGFKMLPTSVRVTSTSFAPTAASTPKASTSGIALPISIPLTGHPGRRSDFLTDAFQAGNLADLDEELDEDLRKMAGDVSHKQMAGSKCVHDEDIDKDKEGDDGDGSMFEDLDEPLPAPAKRFGKAKSPAKSGPVNWLPAEVDIVCQNRYAMDQSKMRDYHRNYLSLVDQKTFNLKNHSKYLDIILAKPSIMQDVVFTVEKGWAYFTETCKVPTHLYDQGVLTPLPASPGSKWFLDREVVAVVYVMVIVAHPSGQNIADNDPDGFGRTCLMGFWGLHREGTAAMPQDMLRRGKPNHGGILSLLWILDDERLRIEQPCS